MDAKTRTKFDQESDRPNDSAPAIHDRTPPTVRTKTNPRNDRIKRDYLIWLKEANQRSMATVDQARHAIDRYEGYTGFKDFATFNKDQALGFKAALAVTPAQRTGAVMSVATVHHTLKAIQGFLAWVQGREEFRRRIKAGDIAYLNLTTGDERRARTTSPKQYPSFEEFRSALFAMPAGSEIERRNQALMAYLLLTGARDSAAIGLKMGDVDLIRNFVFQNPRHTKTKFSKAIDTFFYPVGDDVAAIFKDWISYLTKEKGFAPGDPVFPKTIVRTDADQKFAATGIGRTHWATAEPVRKCFANAFARIGLPYSEPHRVRDTLVRRQHL